jgi:D-sedoheptulose 7-phosphate isomerase
MNQRIAEAGSQAVRLLEQLSRQQTGGVSRLAQKLSGTFASGGQLLVAGSGTLQPLAQLLASFFTFKLGFDRPVLPAVALGADPVLAAAMVHAAQVEQLLARHYRALNNGQQLLLLLSDGSDQAALRAVRDAALENGQPVALISARGEADSLCRDGVEICIDLGTDNLARSHELILFVGHLLCELVEAELFGV